MKKILFSLFGAVLAMSLYAQTPEPYEFTEFKRLPATEVKSQGNTGTCWSFSTTSFLESEAIRMGKGSHDFSEIFTVRNIYRQKCENFIRRLGKAQFGEGGLAHDNLNAVRQYGIVPESVYPGRKDASKPHNHSGLEEILKKKCNEFVALAEKGQLPDNWLRQIDDILDTELGPVPIKFTYNNIQFTPSSFRDYLGINPDDYVNITSFSHHPFWTNFILEVPDNFANGSFFNMPLGDLMRCLNNSIQKGFTVEWDADVSNPGFSARNGLALAPEADWSSKSREQIAGTFEFWEPEKPVTQSYRQQLFDRMETQDDHLMHIVGLLNETHGGIYYVVKNSWGEISDLKGFVYVSEAYMRLNTLSFTLHKNALPKDIRQRMGLEAEPGGGIKAESDADNSPGGAAPASSGADIPPPPGAAPASNSKLRNPHLKTMPAQRAPASKE